MNMTQLLDFYQKVIDFLNPGDDMSVNGSI